MYRDPTPIDRLKADASQQSSGAATQSRVENQRESSVPSTAANPEFAKWWKRWVSRAQRISVRRNPWARRNKMEAPGSNPQATPAKPADREFKRY